MLFRYLSAILILAGLSQNAAANQGIGYNIKFDYDKYPIEREAAYQHFIKEYSEYSGDCKIEKSQIGIDLYDIDDDGKKEIFAYLKNSNYCGTAGCSFEILKQSKNGDYLALNWDVSDQQSRRRMIVQDVAILKELTNNTHNLLFNNLSIWQWNGNNFEWLSNLKGKPTSKYVE